MSRVINYKDLFVWQKSLNLAKEVYAIFPKVTNEKLVDLMAKTSISISSNIAEGNSRQISKDYRQYLYCALGDISQIDCQLYLAKEMEFITLDEYKAFEDRVIELRKMLYGLISKLRQRTPRPFGPSSHPNGGQQVTPNSNLSENRPTSSDETEEKSEDVIVSEEEKEETPVAVE